MIEIINLKKSFDDFKVLKEINLSIREGEITAIVGPNGSGKTTLIKSILDLIKIDFGKISIGKYVLNGKCEYRKQIGYMPQITRFPENLTVSQLIEMIKDIRNQTGNLDEELFEKFLMEKELPKQIKNLSGGTKQKLNAIISFMFNPQLYILDEPTASLDPIASSELKDKIIKENKNGKTFLITSHNMHEIEELASNIIFMIDGEIAYCGSLSNLKFETKEDNLERAIANLMRLSKN